MENKSIIDLTKPHNKADIENKIQELKKTKKVIATCGYFDPLHFGHVELITLSKKLGDYLIVIVNNDSQTKQKKGYVFMPAEEKAKIISALEAVDEVFISIDQDQTQCKTLELLKPHVLAKGGDRYVHEIPETPICKQHGIQIIDGVGAKVQSSSTLIANAALAQEKMNSSQAS